MKKTSILFLTVVGLLIFLTNKTDGKKYGSTKVRTGFKVPRPAIVPVFIPVVIPGGRRNSYRNRVQCYSCNGIDNDLCVNNPASGARRVTCPKNSHCSVVRREWSMGIPDKLFKKTNNVSAINATSVSLNSSSTEITLEEMLISLDGPTQASNETVDLSTDSITPAALMDSLMPTESSVEINITSTTETIQLQNDATGTNSSLSKGIHVTISRGCRAPEYVESTSQFSNSENGLGLKTYTQYCMSDLCNFGDGRLKCYSCTSQGAASRCMVNPSSGSNNIVTCKPNHYCNILRTETTSNATEPVVTITRGCKAASATDDDYPIEDGISLLTLSCSSDLCNYIDGNQLANVNAGTSLSFPPHLVLTFLLAYILQH